MTDLVDLFWAPSFWHRLLGFLLVGLDTPALYPPFSFRVFDSCARSIACVDGNNGIYDEHDVKGPEISTPVSKLRSLQKRLRGTRSKGEARIWGEGRRWSHVVFALSCLCCLTSCPPLFFILPRHHPWTPSSGSSTSSSSSSMFRWTLPSLSSSLTVGGGNRG